MLSPLYDRVCFAIIYIVIITCIVAAAAVIISFLNKMTSIPKLIKSNTDAGKKKNHTKLLHHKLNHISNTGNDVTNKGFNSQC